jgi:ADP-ribosylglycohydrolase
MIDNNGKAMVMAAFLADALALGAHWIYDTNSISQRYGRIEDFIKPGPNSYHPTKEKGEFTHYGDQMFVLLESLAEIKTFDLQDFSDRWQWLFKDYHGYIDQATRATLSGYASGKTPKDAGSFSDDLAGASRIAPVIYRYRNDLEKLIRAARSQTILTHNSAGTVESAAFFANVGWQVLNGMTPIDAIEHVSEGEAADSIISSWVQAGLRSKDTDSIQAISQFGQSCHTQEAFPGVIHLIARHENDLKEALIQSVMAGGDSAARGMVVGMVLGAYQGPESLPKAWLLELRKEREISEYLDQIQRQTT